MKASVPRRLFLGIVLMNACVLSGRAAEEIEPKEAAKRVEAGAAVLIDVREPDEWTGGVAQPALLLSLSDLQGERKTWADVLKANAGKELIVYCRSGRRAAAAASALEKEGFKVGNAGGFDDWRNAGLPVRKPGEGATKRERPPL